MWDCPNCGEENEPNFNICWNYRWGQDGTSPVDADELVASIDEYLIDDVRVMDQILNTVPSIAEVAVGKVQTTPLLVKPSTLLLLI